MSQHLLVGVVHCNACVLVFVSSPGQLVVLGAADSHNTGPWDTVNHGVDMPFALPCVSLSNDSLETIGQAHHATQAGDSNIHAFVLHNQQSYLCRK